MSIAKKVAVSCQKKGDRASWYLKAEKKNAAGCPKMGPRCVLQVEAGREVIKMAKKYRKRDLWAQKVWHQAPYTVVTFFMRRDNQGNPRVFRNEYGVSTYAQAKACFEDRVNSGKNLFVVWYGLNQRVVQMAGDPEVQSYWTDANKNRRTALHS